MHYSSLRFEVERQAGEVSNAVQLASEPLQSFGPPILYHFFKHSFDSDKPSSYAEILLCPRQLVAHLPA
jgi:hypothetical protein